MMMERVELSRWTETAAKGRKWNCKNRNDIDLAYVHSQVLKIRAEDSNIGEDNAADILSKLSAEAAGEVVPVVVMRPVLRASPLGGQWDTTRLSQRDV